MDQFQITNLLIKNWLAKADMRSSIRELNKAFVSPLQKSLINKDLTTNALVHKILVFTLTRIKISKLRHSNFSVNADLQPKVIPIAHMYTRHLIQFC